MDSFYQGPRGYTKEEKKVARHEAAHFIVMVYLLRDILPLITLIEKVVKSHDNQGPNGTVCCNHKIKQEEKEFLYVYLAGAAMDSLIPCAPDELLGTEPNFIYPKTYSKCDLDKLLGTERVPYSDLDRYLTLYKELNHVVLDEVIIKDFEETVKICTKLEKHIIAFADLLLEKTIIEGVPLAQQIEFYSNKHLLKDFS